MIHVVGGMVDRTKFVRAGVAVSERVIRPFAVPFPGHIARVRGAGPEIRHDVIGAAVVLGKENRRGGSRYLGYAPPGLRLANVIIVRPKLVIDVQAVAPRRRASV